MGQNCKPCMVLWYLLSILSSSDPNADILVTSLVLKHCAHALRQPRGCYLFWNETLLALRFDASPRPRSGSGESIGYYLHRFQSQHACAVAPGCWTSMRFAPTKILLDRVLSQAGVLDRVLSYATCDETKRKQIR